MLLIGSDPLTQFLNRAAETPFAWGQFDCLLWLADWIAERGGVDPALGLRGCYSTMLGAARIVADAGGMVALVEGRVELAGVSRAACGARGDIAVIDIAGDGGEQFGNQAGAILLGGTAVFLSQAGLLILQRSEINLVAAWRV